MSTLIFWLFLGIGRPNKNGILNLLVYPQPYLEFNSHTKILDAQIKLTIQSWFLDGPSKFKVLNSDKGKPGN